MSPRIFVVNRQVFGTFFIAPIAYFSRLTTNQMMQCVGVYLASSSASSASSNLISAITFVGASIVGLEPINIRSLRTMAKIVGTVVCVSSAAAMTQIKGPKFLNAQLHSSSSLYMVKRFIWK